MIENGWLKDVERVESPNRSGPFRPGEPRFIVLHYTATLDRDAAVRALTNPDRPASAHLVVDRDGSMVQLGPFGTVMWHAGRSRWKGVTGLNRHAIGIEIVNAGWLTEQADGHFRTWNGDIITEPGDVGFAVHPNGGPRRPWQVYPRPQLEATERVVRELIDHFRAPDGQSRIVDVVGHDDVAPDRKVDPGPLFPRERFSSLVEPRRDDAGLLLKVTAHRLNVREGPGVRFGIARAPLPRGTRVRAHDTEGGWVQVGLASVRRPMGWVAARYLAAA